MVAARFSGVTPMPHETRRDNPIVVARNGIPGRTIAN
jgi:hypothetical protein